MEKFFRQTWALAEKTLRIVLFRFGFSTSVRAFIFPVFYIGWIGFSRNLLAPPAKYGVGSPFPVRSLIDEIGGMRLVLINNGMDGDVKEVIDMISGPLIVSGKDVRIMDDDSELGTLCKQSLRGASDCYSIAAFHSSPQNPALNGKYWNYTMRGDSSLGTGRLDVGLHTNDVQSRLFPLQHAIDSSIAKVTADINLAVPEEYIYTDETEEERQADLRRNYHNTIINATAVTFLIGLIGIVYQLVGFMAMERESGISELIEVMGGTNIARLLSYHIAFDMVYAPGWIIIGLLLHDVFAHTSRAILILHHLIAGLSLSSFSLVGAAFFKKAQLSGITVTIISLVLGVIGQILHKKLTSAGVFILGLLFPTQTYVFFLVTMARFEKNDLSMNLLKTAPQSTWPFAGIVFWIFSLLQIVLYPFLALLVEKYLYGTKGTGRVYKTSSPDNAVEIRGFSKLYPPGFLDKRGGVFMRKSKKKDTVVAVDDLTLDIRKGSIVGLLGANGSGKTTTLESVVGLGKITSGTIAIDGKSRIGICPQKNVLWDHLTVEEHVKIWNRVKCKGHDIETLHKLISLCDLEPKRKAQARTLSGGQKRKLQLALMFTGDSTICAIDEVSSGLDPLSRRKIWDIILGSRGHCTIIHTTHFLDEADILSDHIAILSKGKLKAEGSSVELKAKLGGGYRVRTIKDAPDLGVPTSRPSDRTIYNTPDSASASRLVLELEKRGIDNYQIHGPTIEDVFLTVAKDSLDELIGPDAGNGDIDLYTGKKLGVFQQSWVMYRKRLTILRRNYLPTLAAVAIPIIAAGVTMLLFKNADKVGCKPSDILVADDPVQLDLSHIIGPDTKMVVGPSSVSDFVGGLLTNSSGGSSADIGKMLDIVNTFDEFTARIESGFASNKPGGLFLPENGEPVFAFLGNDGTNEGIKNGMILQNLVNNIIIGTNITMYYQELPFPWADNQGNILQFIIYFGLAMAVYPAFFSLYPNIERTRQIRALHYSNGVRPLPLWLSYLLFDFSFVVALSTVCVIIFAASANVWYGLGYLYLIILLYGLTSILLAYTISQVARTQLSSFAFAAGGQAGMLFLYFIAYLTTLTFAPIPKLDSTLNKVHWGMAAISPVNNLMRALFVSLNSFSIVCRDTGVASNLGEIPLYGGPVLLLILQSVVLFGVLIISDSGLWGLKHKLRRRRKLSRSEEAAMEKPEVTDELTRVASSNDGLRVLHLTKQFGKKNLAVDNVTFGIPRSEVFALLGPNGAGKTTTINMIRGDMKPDDGDIFVQNISVISNRAGARAYLGVCPQFDAIDQMTVLEHLRFYARARGVTEVEHNVQEVMRATGLNQYSDRMAATLSGGNKRKLSLGIALIGNPTVLLLDEPSSGMDAASKRVMWKTLAAVAPGRSLILTTHSMEEADALASRVGILAKRMVALGTSDHLHSTHGDKYHIHLILKSAPNSSQEEVDNVKTWILKAFPGADVEAKSILGQIKFSVPAHLHVPGSANGGGDITEGGIEVIEPKGGVSSTFATLEENKEELGLEYYSVAQTSLEDIFLKIVKEANVIEEGYLLDSAKKKKKKWGWF